jgi:hypothetical protein
VDLLFVFLGAVVFIVVLHELGVVDVERDMGLFLI